MSEKQFQKMFREYLFCLSNDEFPKNVDEAVKLACMLEVLSRQFIPSNEGFTLHYMFGMLRDSLDVYLLGNCDSDNLGVVFEKFHSCSIDCVRLFATDFLIKVALKVGDRFKSAFDFLVKFYGEGDVLEPKDRAEFAKLKEQYRDEK